MLNLLLYTGVHTLFQEKLFCEIIILRLFLSPRVPL